MKTFADRFLHDDGPLPAGPTDLWQVIVGDPQILDHALDLPAAGPTQAIALGQDELDSLEQLVRCDFQVDLASAVPYAGLMARAELVGGGSPAAISRCYLVTIAGSGLITVWSYLLGAGVVTLGSCTCDNFDIAEVHNFAVKVRDNARGAAEILVFLDDLVTPILAVQDRRTDKPMGRYVGFDINDLTGGQHVTLGEFYAHVLRSAVIKNPAPVPVLRNFGDLKYEAAFRLDRGGDSQFNQTMMGNFINDAQNEIFFSEEFWWWADRTLCFITKAEDQNVEFPAYVGLIYDLTETTSGRQLGRCTLQDINRVNPQRSASGVPTAYCERGIGDLAGRVITFDRKCAGQYAMVLDYYAKAVPMIEDTDLPMIPPEFNEILILGALERGFQHSDDLKGFQMVAAKKNAMLVQMRRANHRTAKGVTRMRTVNELARTAQFSGPMTRMEQLGY